MELAFGRSFSRKFYAATNSADLLANTDPIVDFGCGSGIATKWFTEQGYYVHGVDILEYWERTRVC
jgi:2-polyprenyl-3-methyl-5-hydroxy-6-metoxy-1,4-benzoquinol methylase